jgi:hypothetical protein
MIPDVVAKACAELGAAADVFAIYSPLCHTPAYRAVETLEALLEGADASSFFKTVDWDALGRVVPPAVRRLAGERPSWRRAVAAAFFSAFFLMQRGRRLGGEVGFVLCAWADEEWQKRPRHPAWRVVEAVDPDAEYRLEQLEALGLPKLYLRKVWRRASAFGWPGKTRHGTHLILAALTTLLKNDEEQ